MFILVKFLVKLLDNLFEIDCSYRFLECVTFECSAYMVIDFIISSYFVSYQVVYLFCKDSFKLFYFHGIRVVMVSNSYFNFYANLTDNFDEYHDSTTIFEHSYLIFYEIILGSLIMLKVSTNLQKQHLNSRINHLFYSNYLLQKKEFSFVRTFLHNFSMNLYYQII